MPVRPQGLTCLSPDRFSWNFILETFIKIYREKLNLVKKQENIRSLTRRSKNVHHNDPVDCSRNEKNVSDESCRENRRANFTSNTFLFEKKCHLRDNYKKCSRNRLAINQCTQYGAMMIQFECHVLRQKYRIKIFNTYLLAFHRSNLWR